MTSRGSRRNIDPDLLKRKICSQVFRKTIVRAKYCVHELRRVPDTYRELRRLKELLSVPIYSAPRDKKSLVRVESRNCALQCLYDGIAHRLSV